MKSDLPNPAGEGRNTLGRPRGQSENRRQRLLSALAQLLVQRDGGEPSVGDIAEAAGSTPALIKYYFGDKDGLFVALHEQILLAKFEEELAIVESDAPASEKLRQHVRAVIKTRAETPFLDDLSRRVIRSCSTDEARDIADRLIRPSLELYLKIFETGMASGEFKKRDPMLTMYTVHGACDRIFRSDYVLKTFFGRDGVDADLLEQFTAHTVEIIMDAVLAEGEKPMVP
jgi:TetR/AcrR family transcriptional regulator